MEVSRFLGKTIGIYLLILGIAMLVNLPQFTYQISSLVGNPSILFVTGFFTLILGILMVVSHNVWQLNWRLLITLVSWITFLKGVTILFYPQFIDQMTFSFLRNLSSVYVAIGINLVLGVVLVYCGFRK